MEDGWLPLVQKLLSSLPIRLLLGKQPTLLLLQLTINNILRVPLKIS